MSDDNKELLYRLCWRIDGVDEIYKGEPMPLEVCERWLAIEKKSGYTFTSFWIERDKPE